MENEHGLMEKLLVIAVPQWIEVLKRKSFKDFEKRREAILESVCYKGDLLLYGSKKKGETAKLFNDLAEGLAWLALIAKGGVRFGDLHWDAEFVGDHERVSGLREGHNRHASKQEVVSGVSNGKAEAPAHDADAGADRGGSRNDR